MALFRRLLLVCSLSLVVAGCSAQTQKTDAALNRRIELEVRSQYTIPPDVDVSFGQRTPSDVPGFDKLPITVSKGERSSTLQFLIAKDNSKLVRWSPMDLTVDPMSRIDVNGRPYRGGKDAKVVIVNFDDFQCPFCAMLHQELFPNILKLYGDRVKIIYKDYPIVNIHPWAMHAAIDANCLAAQSNDAYWDFADYTHLNQKSINSKEAGSDPGKKLDAETDELAKKRNLDVSKVNACVKQQSDSAVRASMQEGDKLGINSTPTFYINGEKLEGAQPEEALRAAIDRALRAAGEPVPASAGPASAKPVAQ